MIVKRRDKRTLRWQVVDAETGEVQNLTGSTCRLLLRRQYSDEVQAFPMNIEEALQGIVTYNYDGTLDAGTYDLEVEVTGPAGDIDTSPTEGYNILQVEPDLG